MRFRIWKYDISSGTSRILHNNLFGYGDNLKLTEDGDLLVAIFSTRDGLTEFIKNHPTVRKMMMYIPERLALATTTKRAGGVRINTESGQIMEYMMGAPTKTNRVTTIFRRHNKTYFGSLTNPTIVVLDDSAKPGVGSEPNT